MDVAHSIGHGLHYVDPPAHGWTFTREYGAWRRGACIGAWADAPPITDPPLAVRATEEGTSSARSIHLIHGDAPAIAVCMRSTAWHGVDAHLLHKGVAQLAPANIRRDRGMAERGR